MSIREEIRRFRELHQELKAGTLTTAEARKRYETERDELMRTLVLAQQLTLKPGQSARQALRIRREVRVVLQFGARREGTITLDLAVGGFAAAVGPLAVSIVGEFELDIPPAPVKGRAKVVASMKDPDGSYRTSFAIDWMTPDDRKRLEILVMDAVLDAFPSR